MKKLVFCVAILLCGCIKPPDDGMALGDPTSADSINQAFDQAQSGVAETQAFHQGDSGVIESVETVFSSSRIKEISVRKITGCDQSNIYFDDFKVKADTTTKRYVVRANAPNKPAPTPTPLPTPTTTTLIQRPAGLWAWLGLLKKKVTVAFSKVSFQFSTAVGQTIKTSRWNMSGDDVQMLLDLRSAIQKYAVDPSMSTKQIFEESSGDPTYSYYGLQVYTHKITTSNCAQLKDCAVNATHVQFNQVDQATGDRIHWVYEISKEVPGLFMILSQCASSVAIIKETQVPFMECNVLDTFHFGSGPPPP